jgi:hypothetical protein
VIPKNLVVIPKNKNQGHPRFSIKTHLRCHLLPKLIVLKGWLPNSKALGPSTRCTAAIFSLRSRWTSKNTEQANLEGRLRNEILPNQTVHVWHRKAASVRGLNVSPALLARADEVIE